MIKRKHLFDIDGKRFAISIGRKTGSYPGEIYACDFTALEFQHTEVLDLKVMFSRSSAFQHSVMIGMSDGNIGVSEDSRYFEAFRGKLNSALEDIYINFPEYNHEMIAFATMSPPVTKVGMFKPEAVEVVAKGIEEVLRDAA